VSATYQPVAYGRFERLDPRRWPLPSWRRRFLCPDPTCEARRRATGKRGPFVLGQQTVRAVYEYRPEAGHAITGYLLEKVVFAGGLIRLADLPDGTLSIGLSEQAFGEPDAALHVRRRHSLLSGDPTFVGRHDPRRARGRGPYWGLEPEAAGRPAVVTCPDCRPNRFRLDSLLPADEVEWMRVRDSQPRRV